MFGSWRRAQRGLGPGPLGFELWFIGVWRNCDIQVAVLKFASPLAVEQRGFEVSGGRAIGAVKDPNRCEALALLVAAIGSGDSARNSRQSPIAGRWRRGRRRLSQGLPVDACDGRSVAAGAVDFTQLIER